MNNFQQPADKVAIGLSLLCAIHCLATPLLLVLIPSLASLPLEGELLHKWMVAGVLPISLFALTLGCKKHRQQGVVKAGLFGLFLLVFAIVTSMLGFGELVEKALTLAGAGFIALAHVWNYRLCKEQKQSCECS